MQPPIHVIWKVSRPVVYGMPPNSDAFLRIRNCKVNPVGDESLIGTEAVRDFDVVAALRGRVIAACAEDATGFALQAGGINVADIKKLKVRYIKWCPWKPFFDHVVHSPPGSARCAA